MEFKLVSSANQSFAKADLPPDVDPRTLMAFDFMIGAVQPAPDFSSSSLAIKFANKLEGLLFAHAHGKGKRPKLYRDPIVQIRIVYETEDSVTHTCKIYDANKTELLKRLVNLCGGPQNISANLKFELGTEEEGYEFRLNLHDLRMDDDFTFKRSFDFTEFAHGTWQSWTDLRVKLQLLLKLNAEALNYIHLATLTNTELGNRQLLDAAKYSGNAAIVLENGQAFWCHKGILAAQSPIFKVKLRSGNKKPKLVYMPILNEVGVKAMLDYLYCCDLEEPLRSSCTAVELLAVSDEFAIVRLFEAMKEIVLGMKHEWFSVGATLKLINFVINKEPGETFMELTEKAKALLKAKSKIEWKQCPELREELKIPDTFEFWDNSLIWVECVKTADENGNGWMNTFQSLILEQENDNFTVEAAVKLLVFVKGKKGDTDFKALENKAVSVIRAKPMSVLKQCSQFCKYFRNTESAMEIFAYFYGNA